MNELLNEKEKRVLEALYQMSERSVGKLSKETMINRTSLYPILEKLIEKGLVSAVNQDGVTQYDPINPALFKAWLQQKREEAVKESNTLSGWLEQATSANQSPSLVSRMQYFEGYDGLKNLYADTWRNNDGKMIYAITDVKAAVECAEDFFHHDYMPRRVRHGVQVRDIMTESDEARHEIAVTSEHLREAKLAKGLFENLGVEINIYDNKTAIAAYDKQKPCGVIIENETIAKAMKNIFEYLWDRL